MTEARPRSEQRCAICGGAAEPAQLAECADCGAWFHLELDRRVERGCGAPSFGAACGLSLSCDPCIEAIEAAAERQRAKDGAGR